jgi:putative RNA 2'-phosphotransferase
MTDPALIERITRSLAFMLRHQPETFDLELDPHGFVELSEVVRALNERLGEPVVLPDVEAAIASGDRQRYEIQDGRIRALYGHSIPIEPGPSTKPPERLYLAIPEQDVERARRFGLRGGRRRFLHLALTPEDACDAGRRLARDYTLLTIRSLEAWEEGVNFYDRRSLWLADEVPTHLIEAGETLHDGHEPERPRSDRPAERFSRERESLGRGESRGDPGSGERGFAHQTAGAASDEFRPQDGQSRRGRRRGRRGGRRDDHHGSRHDGGASQGESPAQVVAESARLESSGEPAHAGNEARGPSDTGDARASQGGEARREREAREDRGGRGWRERREERRPHQPHADHPRLADRDPREAHSEQRPQATDAGAVHPGGSEPRGSAPRPSSASPFGAGLAEDAPPPRAAAPEVRAPAERAVQSERAERKQPAPPETSFGAGL